MNLKALKDSVQHWEDIVKCLQDNKGKWSSNFDSPNFAHDFLLTQGIDCHDTGCALCELYLAGRSCNACPLAREGYQCIKVESPHAMFDNKPNIATAKNMLNILKQVYKLYKGK